MGSTSKYIIKKYNIEIGKEAIIPIPQIGRKNLAELFAELKFDEGAEVGVEWGEYSEILCRANPKLHLSCIDPWLLGTYEPQVDAVGTEQEWYEKRYKETVKRLKPFNCTIMRMKSMEAVEKFEDESLDFVYIDANHDFPNFINDLHQWKKKVRPGGIVSGHDYANFPYRKFNHVKRALNTYAKCYRMYPLFIAGANAKTRVKGEIRDNFRSWFWVKE